ncbi:unnamed protein product [Prunus armeniaca]
MSTNRSTKIPNQMQPQLTALCSTTCTETFHLEPLTCSVSNFNYICLITSMKLPLPLLSRPVKGTPNPDAKFTGSQFLLGLLRDENISLTLSANPSQGQKAALKRKLTALHEVICSKASIEKIT